MNIQYASVDDDGEPEIVYYNADIINNKTEDLTHIEPLTTFNESRDSPIIRNTSNYTFSIVRFTMNGPNKELPIFMPSIRTGQSDINLTNYSLRLDISVNGTNYTSDELDIYFRTETGLYQRVPSPPLKIQDVTNYYFVYTYNHWVDIINEHITKAYNTVLSLAGVTDTPPVGKPVLRWNGASENTFSLFFNIKGNTATEVNLYFNKNLYGLFASFYSVFDNHYEMYQIVNKLNNVGTNIITSHDTNSHYSNQYYEIKQDYESTSSLWCPIDSIVFCSTVIPINYEFVGEPNYSENGSNAQKLSGSTNAFAPIITDIALPMTSAHDYRSFLFYIPSAEYRLTSFSGSSQAIQNVNVQVYFKTRLDGSLLPLSMFNLSSVSIKMMFRKKNRGK